MMQPSTVIVERPMGMGMGMGMGGQVIVERPMGMGMGMGGPVIVERPMGMGVMQPQVAVVGGMGGAVVVERPMPHVKPICFRCNNTHRGICGKPYNCHHCVCIKCHGFGFHNGHKCFVMETTL